MKLKYFMRGFGIGVVFTTLIVAISLTASSRKPLSDEEIIQKAEKLGMVMETTESYLASLNKKNTETSTETTDTETNTDNEGETNTDLKDTEVSKEEITTEPTRDSEAITEPTTSTTTQPTTATTQPTTAATTQATTASTTQATTPAATNSQSNSEMITVEIKKGTWSNHLASLLKEKGLVDNAKDFDDYLIKNGYQNKIRVGTFQIAKGSTYAQIVKIVTN